MGIIVKMENKKQLELRKLYIQNIRREIQSNGRMTNRKYTQFVKNMKKDDLARHLSTAPIKVLQGVI